MTLTVPASFKLSTLFSTMEQLKERFAIQVRVLPRNRSTHPYHAINYACAPNHVIMYRCIAHKYLKWSWIWCRSVMQDYSVSQTTLEQIFVYVVCKSNLQSSLAIAPAQFLYDLIRGCVFMEPGRLQPINGLVTLPPTSRQRPIVAIDTEGGRIHTQMTQGYRQ